jgi:hypothetical protein
MTTTAKVFDSYRTLRTALEEKRVFSRDRIEASEATGGSVVIDAIFPPTYGKSTLGIGLTEAEKQERAMLLNVWVASLLSRYYQCTQEAQELIRIFFGLDEDNPAEPQNIWIVQMLRRQYRPPLKKIEEMKNVKKDGSSNNSGNNNNNSSSGNNNKNNSDNKKKKQTNDNTSGTTEVAANECRCIIS